MANTTEWLRHTPIAHRGLYDNIKIAENSATSIRLALEKKLPILLNINITKDGTFIIFYGDKLSHMTNIDGYIPNVDYAEIEALTLLSTTDTILTLKKALSIIQGQVPVILDLRPTVIASHERALLDEIVGYTGEIAVECTNPYILEWFKLNAPNVKRGQVASKFKGEKVSFGKKHKLRRLKYNGISEPNYISYKLEDAKPRFIKKHAKSTPVLLWIIRDRKSLHKAYRMNANIVFDKTPEVEEIIFAE